MVTYVTLDLMYRSGDDMTEYEQIIKEINDIFEKSEYKKRHIKITDDSIYDKYFKYMFEHDIAIEFVDHLNKLLAIEEVMNHFSKYEDPYAANKNLIDICIHQKNNSIYSDKYNRVIEILNNAVLKHPAELKENFGYIVLISEYDEFESLCKDLNIGMFQKMDDKNKAQIVLANIQKKTEQYKRINDNISKISKEPEIEIIDFSKKDTKIEKNVITNIEDIVNLLKNDNSLRLNGILAFLPVLGYEGYCQLIERLKEENIINELEYLELFDLRLSDQEEKSRKKK